MIRHKALLAKRNSEVMAKMSLLSLSGRDVSNRWTGIWNETINERTQLQFICVSGAAQSRSNYLVYL